jgi:deoxycytidylate deaminase
MNMRHLRRLHDVYTIARDTIPVAEYRLASGIYFRNTLIAIGVAKEKSHPLAARFGKNPDAIYPHAEIDAIINALKVIDETELQNCVIYVARARKDSTISTVIPGVRPDIWGYAKPCIGCSKAIFERFKMKEVIYTTDSENIYEAISAS